MPRRAAVNAVKRGTKRISRKRVQAVNPRQFKTEGGIQNAIYTGRGSFQTIVEPSHGVSGFASTGEYPNTFQTQVRATPRFVPATDPSTSGFGTQARTPGFPAPRYQDPAYTSQTNATRVTLLEDFDNESLPVTAAQETPDMMRAASLAEHQAAQDEVARGGAGPSLKSEGLGSLDPAVGGRIADETLLAMTGAYHTPNPNRHSSHNAGNVVRQNLEEGHATVSNYTGEITFPTTGNDHSPLSALYNPTMVNESNTAPGTHYTSGDAPLPRTSGTISFSMSKQKPLTLADFGAPPQPDIRPGYPSKLQSTSVSLYV